MLDAALPIPLLGELTGLVASDGFYRGDFIEQWGAQRLGEKGVRTFADLPLPPDDGADPLLYGGDRAYRLVVTATDITRGRGLRLPWDYREAFGLDPAAQSVASAVRMSMSSPLFFVPRRLKDATTGRTSRIVDGGVMSNSRSNCSTARTGSAPAGPPSAPGSSPTCLAPTAASYRDYPPDCPAPSVCWRRPWRPPSPGTTRPTSRSLATQPACFASTPERRSRRSRRW